MEAEAVSIPLAPLQTTATLARPAGRRVQSTPGMAATRAMDGANRGSSSPNNESRTEASRDLERAHSRALEMDLIREAQTGSRVAFDVLVRQY